jgi:hypothetical protein
MRTGVHREIHDEKNAMKKTKNEAALFAVAETIGSALGSLAATGETAKKAFHTAASTSPSTKRRAGTGTRGAARKLARSKKAVRRTGHHRPSRALDQ